jgi:hypothetical protein
MRLSFFAALASPLLFTQLVNGYIPGYQNSYGSTGADHAAGHDIDSNGRIAVAMTVGDVKAMTRKLKARQLNAAAPVCVPVNGAAACGGASDIVVLQTDTGGATTW